MPTQPMPGRTLVTRRAVVDIVRTATLGSYGVSGFAGNPVPLFLGRLGLAQPGIVVRLADGLDIALDLTVAPGVPIAEVARQVDSAVRYGIQLALGREVRRLTIHIGGLRVSPVGETRVSPVGEPIAPVGSYDLADDGTDVA